MQSNWLVSRAASASAAVPAAVVCTSPSPINSRMLWRCTASSSTTSNFLTRRSTKALIWANAAFSASLVTGFCKQANAPRRRPRCSSSWSEMMCTGMWRVSGSCFSRSSTVQPFMSGS